MVDPWAHHERLLRRVGWALIPCYLLFTAVALGHEAQWAFDPPWLINGLNVGCWLIAGGVVAWLSAAAYRLTGAPAALGLGCGMLLLGVGSPLSSYILGPLGVNAAVTVHNVVVLLGGGCLLWAAYRSLSTTPAALPRGARRHVVATYCGVLGLLGALCLLVRSHALPTFFAQGVGPTPLRQWVVGCAVVAFAVAGAFSWQAHALRRIDFFRWYSSGLLLTALGLAVVLQQHRVGSLVSWAGRSGQFLGALYIMTGLVLAWRDARRQRIGLGDLFAGALSPTRALQAALEDVPAVVWIAHDRECRRISGNREAHALLRVPAGMDVPETGARTERLPRFHAQQDGTASSSQELPIRQVAATGQPLFDYPLEIALADGSVRSLIGNVTPLLAPDGSPVGAIATFLDVTDHKHAERERARLVEELAQERDRAHSQAQAAQQRADELDAVFASIADAVVVYDAKGVPIKANQAAGATFGFDPVGMDRETRAQRITLCDLDGRPVPPEDLPTRRVERGERFREQAYQLTGAHRQTQIIHCAGAPLLLQGRLLGSVLSWHDVTDREVLLQQLRDQQAVLEQRVQERTADLAQKATQLQALTAELTLAEQRERQRLAEVLHDGLQQLLVAANFRLNLLARTESREIADGCREVGRLLDDAVAASRTLTGELTPPILQSGGLVAGLDWLVRWKAQKYQLAVDLDADPQAVPDSEAMTLLLFQSVRELLFNVVKHAQVRAARVVVRRQVGQLLIAVSDRGVGFDPAALSPTSIGGLGLSSIRQRLEYLGGHVDIASAPGQGCCITLAAPLRQAANTPRVPVAEAGDRHAPPCPTCGEKIRLLIADDHAVVRQALAQMLAAEPDLEVVGEAADGKQAVELVRQFLPDIVLMDISMPVMNGIDATQQIHTDNPGVRVIGLSMFGAADQSAAMQSAGAVAYVSKSAPAEEVLAAIRAAARGTA
jgi:signal transduction histidine kinase/ActR/RegA family two-component response regulator